LRKIINKIKSKDFIINSLRPLDEPVELRDLCKKIIDEVADKGDDAIKKYNIEFDRSDRDFQVSDKEIDDAFNEVNNDVISAIEKSISRSKNFHINSIPQSWYNNKETIGERVIPFNRALCYVPGGTAPLVSTAIMTIVPAKIAGVKEVIATSPAPDGRLSSELIVSAKLSGADKIFSLGGIQAIAGFALGTLRLPKVDFICGPGNKYVTEAKKMLYGKVGIDGLYGPTETLVIADKDSDSTLCASDLVAQAEHDIDATPILITDSEAFADEVSLKIKLQSSKLERKEIIEKSISNNGVIFILEDINDSIEISNLIAAEHVSVLSKIVQEKSVELVNAGGLFLGDNSAEVFGDYIAGPSHVMPTGGSARFNSALNVRHFLKYQPLINLNKEEVISLVDDVVKLAEIEKLQGHAESAKNRRKKLIGE